MNNDQDSNIPVLPEDETLAQKAHLLAAKMQTISLPVQSAKDITDFFAVLVVGREKIYLQQCGHNASGAVYVDFISGKADHRRKFGGGKGQMIAKAVGMKKLKAPFILDATAGLGSDAFVLASLGCHVHMVERSPVAFALLEDGLARAMADDQVLQIAERMTLSQGDAYEHISAMNEVPDVIYLDPMFPARDKSALVKKEMRLFKEIIGSDLDADKLLEISLSKAKHRVVVKRPCKSSHLADKEPSFVLEGKANRFDVYV